MAANPNESNGNVHQNGVKNPGKFSDDRLTPKALLYMFLLALQFGIQPVLTKTFTPSSVCRTSVILIQEMIKCLIAGFMLISSGSLKSAVRGEIDITLFLILRYYKSEEIMSVLTTVYI